jgi:hypothetical protein
VCFLGSKRIGEVEGAQSGAYQVGRHSAGCGSTTRSLSISAVVDAGLLTCRVGHVETLLPNPFLLIYLM